jgi:hypothetical protein
VLSPDSPGRRIAVLPEFILYNKCNNNSFTKNMSVKQKFKGVKGMVLKTLLTGLF